ncbi:MAG: hypothetical protein KDA42_07110 [Planctomycetales bacterium]|nr:hypothetical protein [Planctomycetales bacterium]
MKRRRSRSAERPRRRRAAERRLHGLECLEAREFLAADVVGAALQAAVPTLDIDIIFREDVSNQPGAEIAPDSLRVGQTFFVEILAGDIRADAAGLTGLGLDISWPADVLEEVDSPFTPANVASRLVTSQFPELRAGQLDNPAGMIDELRGGVLVNSGVGGVIGVNQLERFSLMRFRVDAPTPGFSMFGVDLGDASVAFADASLDFVLDIERQAFRAVRTPGEVMFQLTGDNQASEAASANYTLRYDGMLLNGQSVSVAVDLIDGQTTPSDYGDLASQLAAAGANQGIDVAGNRVTFVAGGPTSFDFSLPIQDDDLAEGGEEFLITLSGAMAAGGASAEIFSGAVATVIAPSEETLFSIAGPASGNEGDTLRYTISYTGDFDLSASPLPVARVDVSSINLPPTSTLDHGDVMAAIMLAAGQVGGGSITFVNQTLSFRADGPRSLSFDVLLTDDSVAEGDEQFDILLGNPRTSIGALSTLGQSSVRTTIIDNEADQATFDLEGPPTVAEGQSASYTLRHDATLSAGETVSVAVALEDVDTQASDHGLLANALSLAAGITAGVRFESGRVIFESGGPASLNFSLAATQDTIAEGSEAYRIAISSPLGPGGAQATIGNSTVSTVILDDDQIGFRITGPSQVNEGTHASYTISHTGQLDASQTARITVSLTDNTTDAQDHGSLLAAVADAAANTAGVSLSGSTLTFTGGVASSLTFDLPILSDDLSEPSEQFRVRISSISTSGGALANITIPEVVTTIVNVAPSVVTFSLTGDGQVNEGDSANYTLAKSGTLAAGQTASVDVALTHVSTTAADLGTLSQALVSAAASVGGVSASGTTVTFANTAPSSFSFSLPTILDGISEPDETFRLALANAQGTGGVQAGTSGNPVNTTIFDNDAIRFSVTGTNSVAEGDSAIYTVGYTGTLNAGAMAKVQLNLTDISTSAGDHGSLAGALLAAANSEPTIDLAGTTLTFHAGGAKTLNFSITAFLDADDTEPNEAYRITLSEAPDNAVDLEIAAATVTTTIRGIGGSTDARLDVSLVRTPTSTDGLGHASTSPADEPWIDEWTTFFLEVWVSSQDTSVGVESVDVDIAFEGTFFDFDRLEPGPAFGANLNSTAGAGNVRLFGSVATAAQVGADEPLLVGRIRFQPAAAGVPLNTNDPAYVEKVANNEWAAIAPAGNADVTLDGGQQPGTIDVDRLPTTDLYPVMFDLDNSGQIGFSDLAIFTGSFLKSTTASDAVTFKTDFDRSGRTSFGDLSFFTQNFLLVRSSSTDVSYPGTFPPASFAPPPPDSSAGNPMSLSLWPSEVLSSVDDTEASESFVVPASSNAPTVSVAVPPPIHVPLTPNNADRPSDVSSDDRSEPGQEDEASFDDFFALLGEF